MKLRSSPTRNSSCPAPVSCATTIVVVVLWRLVLVFALLFFFVLVLPVALPVVLLAIADCVTKVVGAAWDAAAAEPVKPESSPQSSALAVSAGYSDATAVATTVTDLVLVVVLATAAELALLVDDDDELPVEPDPVLLLPPSATIGGIVILAIVHVLPPSAVTMFECVMLSDTPRVSTKLSSADASVMVELIQYWVDTVPVQALPLSSLHSMAVPQLGMGVLASRSRCGGWE
jgi:hypothetical protein